MILLLGIFFASITSAQPLWLNRAKQTISDTGNGTLDIDSGTAPTGFQELVTAADDQDPGGSPWTVWYLISQGSNWEWGYGTLTDATPDTLSSRTVIEGTNGTSPVNWGAGNKDIFSLAPGQVLMSGDPAATGLPKFLRQIGVGGTVPQYDLIDDPLPIANGGTEAATADEALASLGGGAAGITIFKDATNADIRTELNVVEIRDGTLSTIGSAPSFPNTVFNDSTGAGSFYSNGSYWVPFAKTMPNLVYNGHFEAEDGDGDPATDGLAAGGWTTPGDPTFDYVASAIYDDGVSWEITAVGGADSVELTWPAGTLGFTNAFFGIQYVLHAGAGGDSCRLQVGTGGGTDYDSGSITSTVPLARLGIFQVDADAEATITVTAENATDVCLLDKLYVYLISVESEIPVRPLVVRAVGASDTSCLDSWTSGCPDIVQLVVPAPHPRTFVEITASAYLESDRSGVQQDTGVCAMRLTDGTTTLRTGLAQGADDSGSDQNHSNGSQVTITWAGTIDVDTTFDIDVYGIQCDVETPTFDSDQVVPYIEAVVH